MSKQAYSLVSLNLKMKNMDGIKSIGMVCDVHLR